MLLRSLLPVSYLLYGLIIAVILTIAGVSIDKSVIILIIAYCMNIPLTLMKKPSFVEIIYKCLATPVIRSMFVDNPSRGNRKKSKSIETMKDASTFKELDIAFSFRQILNMCKAFEKYFNLNIKIQ